MSYYYYNRIMFSAYEHMVNAGKCRLPENDPRRYIATEKVHGANLSYITDGTTFSVGKRSSVIETMGFMGHGLSTIRNKPDVFKAYSYLQGKFPSLVSIQIYGEIFGGRYAGKVEKGAVVVQRNMDYCPTNEFLAYDIRMTFSDGTSKYLSFEELEQVPFDTIRLVPVMAKGSLDEMLALPVVFSSVIPAMYGLDPIPEFHAEGYVIRLYSDEDRVIFKLKNPAFDEVEPVQKLPPTQSTQSLCTTDIKRYLTTQRLDNVYAKFSDEGDAVVIREFVEDAIVDYKSDNPDLYPDEIIEASRKALTGMATGLLKKRVN